MNDITALAQRMKAAAEKAGCEQWQPKKNGPGEYGVMVKGSMVKRSGWSTHRPVCDEAVDKKTADFIAAANPANVLALVEALEKAQQANAAQDDHINQQQDRIDTLEKRNADLGTYAGKLESSHKKLREGMAAIYNAICADGASTSVSAILTFVKRAHEESAAAGIQVIEGEG